MATTSSQAATQEALNNAIPSAPTVNSINSITRRAGGLLASKVITLSANNTTASVNIFQLTGSVKIKKLFGIITTKTTLANLTVGSFDLYDSTAVVQLTKADGALSGCAVGTMVAKIASNATTWGKNDNAAGAVMETAGVPDVFAMCVVTQKTGANTYVRFTYTTTDAPIAATMTVYAEYVPMDANSSLVAV